MHNYTYNNNHYIIQIMQGTYGDVILVFNPIFKWINQITDVRPHHFSHIFSLIISCTITTKTAHSLSLFLIDNDNSI